MKWNVKVENLSLKYGNQTALDRLSFTLDDEKIYGLIGRNGAGKTSLLSIIASFREQTEGTLTIAGETPFENRRIMQQVAFYYSRDFKEDSETVKEVIDDTERYRPNFDRDCAMKLVERFQLPLKKKVKDLSKGMQSALNATLGLASRAPITIFDEVYVGMDAPTRDIFYKEVLNEQANYPRIMIISTHLVSEMDYLFDEILILHQGRLLLQEDYETIVSKGATITGAKTDVDDFVRGKKVIQTEELGNTKQVMILGNLSEDERKEANKMGLEVGSVTLQDLFIHLTKEDGANE